MLEDFNIKIIENDKNLIFSKDKQNFSFINGDNSDPLTKKSLTGML